MYKGKEVSIAVPVLNNYIGLFNLIKSTEKGTVIPDHYYVMDNGNKFSEYSATFKELGLETMKRLNIIQPEFNIGVAASWNWFVKNTQEERIISNDDIVFGKVTVEQMVNSSGGLVTVDGFSLFLIRDYLINQLGYFDEDISKNYAFFEDNDYFYRMKLAGVKETHVDSDIIHNHSTTLRNYSQDELEQHHKRFRRARAYYEAKWGNHVHEEIYTTPFDGKKEEKLKTLKPWQEY
jgi:GT2 family glycosyltransferase